MKLPAVNRRRLVVVAAVLLLTAATLAGCGQDIEIDHKVVSAGKPLGGPPPGPGRFEEVWRTKLDGTAQENPIRLVDGHLLAFDGKSGVRAYDARTGKPSWHYREPGRNLNGLAVTDGMVVVNTDRTNDEDMTDGWHTVGLDARTGELRWKNDKRWYLGYDNDGTVGSSAPAIAGDGTVLVQPKNDDERLGIDARTGDTRWKVSVDDVTKSGCTPKKGTPAPKADRDRLLPVRFDCGRVDPPKSTEQVYAGVDAHTGELRWVRGLTDHLSEAVMRDGITFLEDPNDGRPELIGSDGKRLYAPKGRAACPGSSCRIVVTGGRALLFYRDEGAKSGDDRRIAAVDPRTGRSRVIREDRRLFDEQFAAAGSWVYGVQPLAAGEFGTMLPLAARFLDVRSGRQIQTPLPADSGMLTEGVNRGQQVLGAVGDRLVVVGVTAGKQREITAYRRTGPVGDPPQLGGVAPDEWPDPCSLLDGMPDEMLRDDDGEPVDPPSPDGKIDVDGAVIPRTACTYSLDDNRVTVTTNWVARSADEAAAVFSGDDGPAVGGADEMRAEALNDGVMLRVGRYVVTLSAQSDQELIAPVVVGNLRALGNG